MTLYGKYGNCWHKYHLIHQQRCYALYSITPTAICCKLPHTATPVTPYQNQDGNTIILTLPIYLWTTNTNTNQQDTILDSDSDKDSVQVNPILDQLMNPPTPWEQELWHWITCHSCHDELNQLIITGKPIIACSNAAVNMAHFGTFSWIIYSQQALWQGEGIVHSLVEDIYSGWSEAFGILTLLRFLNNYLANYPNTYQLSPKITIYCNNQGVLDIIAKLLAMNLVHAQMTTTNDYNVYAAIQNAIRELYTISVWFAHINGHQDQEPQKKYLNLTSLT